VNFQLLDIVKTNATQIVVGESHKDNEKRRHPRARVSLLADCSARLSEPRILEALIEDISAGGLRILIYGNEAGEVLRVDAPVRGEIISDNPALQMPFSGKIMWRREGNAGAEKGLQVGIAFDENVVLSEVLQSLRQGHGGAKP
jgi:hypothetical protein